MQNQREFMNRYKYAEDEIKRQKQAAAEAKRHEQAPQPQQAAESSGGGNSFMNALGAVALNHFGNEISSAGGTGSQFVGDTVSGMATNVNQPGTVGDGIASSANTAVLKRTGSAISSTNSAGSSIVGNAISGMGTSVQPGRGNAVSNTASAGGRMSASERIAGNRAWGAPDNFETNNGRICRENGYRNYCDAERTEYERGLGGLEKFGKSRGASPAKACKEAYKGGIGDPQVDSNCQYAQELQCMYTKTNKAEYRTKKGKVCKIEDAVIQQMVTNGWRCRYCP